MKKKHFKSLKIIFQNEKILHSIIVLFVVVVFSWLKTDVSLINYKCYRENLVIFISVLLRSVASPLELRIHCILSRDVSKSKIGDRSWGRPKGSLFNDYNAEV